jgi:5'-deoxynucleotidase YfbR-like HD superfamily hydrolase
MENNLLNKIVFDSIAAKRILKVGFVGQAGGIYSAECDSVAAHSTTVTILSSIIAYEVEEELKDIGITISKEDVTLMSTFHDYGETRSLDTGAQSKGVYPDEHCKLHYLERQGLNSLLDNTKIQNKVLELFDSYRKYDSIESIIVHIADNLEGFEKAIYSSRGHKPILNDAKRIVQENLNIYYRKYSTVFGTGCEYLVEKVLIPGLKSIISTYELENEFSNLIIKNKVGTIPKPV